jgi:hypothetical protein
MLSVKSSFGGFTSPYVYAIPADTVIFYNGTYSAPVDGWTLYSAAADNFILGAANQTEVGAVSAASGGTTAFGSNTSTAGAHLGGSTNTPGGTGGFSSSRVTSGDHTHTISPTSATDNSAIVPVNSKMTMLRTTTEQRFFPPNTIHINGTNLVSGTQKLAATTNRYIAGGSSVTDGAATNHTLTLNVSTHTMNHTHNLGPFTDRGSANTSSLQNSSSFDSTIYTHSHVCTATASINALKGKLLKLWIAASQQLPKSATIVMYCGELSVVPSYWKLCDGTNGTVDMRGYFLGYATSAATAHGAVTSETTTYTTSGPSLADDIYLHAHFTTNNNFNTQIGRNHGLQTVTHSHGVADGSVTSTALPANIKLAFLQLVI